MRIFLAFLTTVRTQLGIIFFSFSSAKQQSIDELGQNDVSSKKSNQTLMCELAENQENKCN